MKSHIFQLIKMHVFVIPSIVCVCGGVACTCLGYVCKLQDDCVGSVLSPSIFTWILALDYVIGLMQQALCLLGLGVVSELPCCPKISVEV